MKSKIDDETCNRSANWAFEEILSQRLARRDLMKGGLGAAALALLGGWAPSPMAPRAEANTSLFGFTGVPVSTRDVVTVPPGYAADVLYAWGDPISEGPAFKADASNTAAEQEQQAGMHHDGLHFFPLPLGSGSSTRGLLAVNHEYTDDGLLHVGGMEPWTAEKVAKAQAAVGVSVVEVVLNDGTWRIVRPSRSAQRLTGRTPIRLAGPAAGQAMMKTGLNPTGLTVLGTMNNCAHGATPWGTYLTCEENFNRYFVNRSASTPPCQRRYGINERGAGYRWHEHDPRFDASAHPNEPNRFGWVVEIDPYDPNRQPVKQTALGRFKHEGATVTLAPDNRVVVYMGDDERFEYIYKFVSRKAFAHADRETNRRLLEEGTLYVARFHPDGGGDWRELTHGVNGLDQASGFSSQADVLVNSRAAGDRVGATKMVHESAQQQRFRSYRPVARDGRRSLGNHIRVGHLRPVWRSRKPSGGKARQHQGGHLRFTGRALVRRSGCALDSDGRVPECALQGGSRHHGKQPDACR